uniref:Uncharacterized protein n=1 Tax=Anopheles dirus TaxID=7168 RepID=A0A182NLJ2_9DIPT
MKDSWCYQVKRCSPQSPVGLPMAALVMVSMVMVTMATAAGAMALPADPKAATVVVAFGIDKIRSMSIVRRLLIGQFFRLQYQLLTPMVILYSRMLGLKEEYQMVEYFDILDCIICWKTNPSYCDPTYQL